MNRFRKGFLNKGEEPRMSFWRDKNGVEIDLLAKSQDAGGEKVRAWEIKAGATYSEDYFKNLRQWSRLSDVPPEFCSVIYTGRNPLKTSSGVTVPWSSLVI